MLYENTFAKLLKYFAKKIAKEIFIYVKMIF